MSIGVMLKWSFPCGCLAVVAAGERELPQPHYFKAHQPDFLYGKVLKTRLDPPSTATNAAMSHE